MGEDTPGPRTPKYASFSPKKAEEETKVGTVDINFVDPLSQKVSCKEVYVDPERWSERANTMRFLISADLVNLVTESQQMRNKRFKKAKKTMEETRLAFLVDLWKLRGLVSRVRRAAAVEEEGGPPQDEPCPVRFFVPETYFDDHTLECVKKASAGFSAHLLQEIRLLQERLDLLGGKNWKNLLAYALKYMQTMEIGEIVADAFPDVFTRRTVENAITRGLWDQIDEHQPIVDELEAQMQQMKLLEDSTARFESVQEDVAKKLAAISAYNERHVTAAKKLQEPDPQVPEDSASEVEEEDEEESESDPDDDSASSSVVEAWDEEEEIRKFIAEQGQPPSKAELKKLRKSFSQDAKIAKLKKAKESREQDTQGQKRARVQSLLARWEKTVAVAKEEVKVLEQPLQRAEYKTNQEMDDEFKKQAAAAKALEAEAEQLAQEVVTATEKAQTLTAQVEQEEGTAQQERQAVQELVTEVQGLPPPDPRWALMRQLGEEQVEMMKNGKVVQEKIAKVKGRIRMLRMEIREMYRMLGKVWEDSSGSDDDGGEKPYWLRKRLAKKTSSQKNPFNEHHFLNQEDKVLERRIKRMATEKKLKDTGKILSNLQATRRTQDPGAEGAVHESSVLPFKHPVDEPVKKPRSPRRREVRRKVSEETPKEGVQVRSLQQLRDILESQLRSCAECFGSMLPMAGNLAEIKPRLEKLFELREDDDELEQLEDSLAGLQGLIGEAVGGNPTEASEALRQSLDFGELRKRLSDIRSSQRHLQHELRKLAQPMRRSVSTPFETEFLLSTSRMSSHSLLSLNDAPPSQDGDASLGFKEPLVGSTAKLQDIQRRKTGRGSTRQGRQESVDFGFRPDGAGEESVESWSLFKVSKAQADAGGVLATDAPNAGSTSRGRFVRLSGDRIRQPEPKMSKLQNVALFCDFGDYMSQLQSSKDMWHSASAPELVKRGPSLPDLVKTKGPEEMSLALASSAGKGRWKTSHYGGRKKAPPDSAWSTTGW
mmetsp:Transcript_36983/g.85494  ORF Transcript_36983/g.85494 Transcript_36983/m.85494 type:complete len:996 (-) Transcript_36983:34-3021(-)